MTLRGKVRVQTDGGLKTGLDVIKAAILVRRKVLASVLHQ